MVHLLLAVIYLAFIGLGLPDPLLGCAWPAMYQALGVPVSYAGIISMIIAMGTVVSALFSDRLNRYLRTGVITALSIGLTAAALWGFSASHAFWQLCLWAVPYGLGAGCVDATLNHYVALHFAGRHMSWLHCAWGIGASIGPQAVGYVLTGGEWQAGYRLIASIQTILTAALLLSLPLWKKGPKEIPEENTEQPPMSFRKTFSLPGVKSVMAAFFCYSALEQTAMLWASSFFALHKGVSESAAANIGGLFFLGMTAGRAVNGFLTIRFSDDTLIRMGSLLTAIGICLLWLPLPTVCAVIGLLAIGLGCAPIYPCVIHSTPTRFGATRSQRIIGFEMAAAYTGTCLAPPLFGVLTRFFGVGLFPVYLLAALTATVLLHTHLCRVCRQKI